MAVLVMDTATEVLAVGIGQDGQMLASTSLCILRGHSRLLQPALANVLESAGFTVQDLEQIAVGVGPGSYTGVRIAVSTAKAMATTLQIPLVPLSTLWAIAMAAASGYISSSCCVMTLLYARRQRAFGAIYRKTRSGWEIQCAPSVRGIEEWVECAKSASMEDKIALPMLVVHDFLPHHGVQDVTDLFTTQSENKAGMAMIAVIHLRDMMGNLPMGLYSCAQINQQQAMMGIDTHRVVPEYVLEVEAEVQLRERRSQIHG